MTNPTERKVSNALVNPYDLMRAGGRWLATAREYLQRRAMRGEDLTWGSDEEVRGLTVRDIELMAAEIATSAINDDRKYRHDVR